MANKTKEPRIKKILNDYLYTQVVYGIIAFISGAIAVVICSYYPEVMQSKSIYTNIVALIFLALFACLFFTISFVFLMGAVCPPDTKSAKRATKWADAYDMGAGTSFFEVLLAILLPVLVMLIAVPIVAVLNLVGIRGYSKISAEPSSGQPAEQ